MSLLASRQLVCGWGRPVTAPLDLTLAPGEIVGLVGPNGVGKSTLLATLAGRLAPLSGQVVKAPGLRLSWQTQEVPPVAGLPVSGADLLALTGASPAGLPPWLANRLHLRLDALSGGQRHYLCLWAVLAAEAEVLLLDEPTNHLDPAGTAHLVATVRQRAAQGLGVLVVSHDAELIGTLCQRQIRLSQASLGGDHVG